jgi:hypothetical protein
VIAGQLVVRRLDLFGGALRSAGRCHRLIGELLPDAAELVFGELRGQLIDGQILERLRLVGRLVLGLGFAVGLGLCLFGFLRGLRSGGFAFLFRLRRLGLFLGRLGALFRLGRGRLGLFAGRRRFIRGLGGHHP